MFLNQYKYPQSLHNVAFNNNTKIIILKFSFNHATGFYWNPEFAIGNMKHFHCTMHLTNMHFRLSVFLCFTCVYLILACIFGARGKTYSQSEIDNAFVKMIKRERFYKLVDKQLGCWPQNIIPYTIVSGFSEYTRFLM